MRDYSHSVVSERKRELLDVMIQKLENMTAMCKEMKDGLSETSACRKYNINSRFFRNMVFNRLSDSDFSYPKCKDEWKTAILEWTEKYPDGVEITEEMVDNNEIPYLPIKEEWENLQGEERLYADIFDHKNYAMVPNNPGEAIEMVLETLREREQNIIRLYYLEGYTVSEIGEVYHCSAKNIRNLLHRAILHLRHPKRTAILRYGIEGAQKIKELKDSIHEIAYKKAMEQIEDDINYCIERIKETAKTDYEFLPKLADIPIEDLGLSTRTYNCIYRAGFRNLKEFNNLNRYDLLKIRNMGIKSMEELENVCMKYGIKISHIQEEAYTNIHNYNAFYKGLADEFKMSDQRGSNYNYSIQAVSRCAEIEHLPIIDEDLKKKLINAGFELFDDLNGESMYNIARVRGVNAKDIEDLCDLIDQYNIHMSDERSTNSDEEYVKPKEPERSWWRAWKHDRNIIEY